MDPMCMEAVLCSPIAVAYISTSQVGLSTVSGVNSSSQVVPLTSGEVCARGKFFVGGVDPPVGSSLPTSSMRVSSFADLFKAAPIPGDYVFGPSILSKKGGYVVVRVDPSAYKSRLEAYLKRLGMLQYIIITRVSEASLQCSHQNKLMNCQSTSHPFHTTRSWNFMLEQVKQGGYGRGLSTKFQQKTQGPYHDVIVGHFDSGVWPESSSFNDNGLGPVPDYFKGQCTAGDNFPSNTYCIVIGAYHAFRSNIVVVASAGNDKPKGKGITARDGSVTNVAPCMITVGASTADRQFVNSIVLGNKNSFQVKLMIDLINYLNSLKLYTELQSGGISRLTLDGSHPITSGGNSLKNSATGSKILVCFMERPSENRTDKSEVVRQAGGVGMILVDKVDLSQAVYVNYVVPAVVIRPEEARQIEDYIKKTKTSFASISPVQEKLNTKPSPKMAYFFSKGPNSITSDIIKVRLFLLFFSFDNTILKLNILAAIPHDQIGLFSGTSMAAPHVMGVAAVLQATNKRWSAAAIKSALMTTAILHDNTGNPIQSGNRSATPFDRGSGHLEPDLAFSPGLVLEFNENDLIDFLCYHRKDHSKVNQMVGKNVQC
ncbi:hypothetical protein Ddye_008311 [Dipteronia dyeriana]|uniref:Peptidase S8/S53 domain-containing protein n=1 Tax=Dipteronia dyeriana TaxID=168575 RepID=A0AAD9X9F8_9ROSI|nr:hypothetical protein Ddye_008311 [Dipteronia dyeriana]